MPPVFNRYVPDPHPYESALSAWLLSGDSGKAAMANNIRFDHRVTALREADFDDFGKSPRSSEQLEDAICDYAEHRVQTQLLPAYVDRALNADNILTGSTPDTQLVSKDIELVHALDVSGLRPVLQFAKLKGRTSLADMPDDLTEFAKWLDQELDITGLPLALGYAKKEAFAAEVIDILNMTRKHLIHQPTWVSTWVAFEPHKDAAPERWLEVFGVKKTSRSRWIMLLRYTVREAGTLVRPCQLDAGWYAYHFPSPPCALPFKGGHPMDLRAMRQAPIIPEFIHNQINHSMNHWYKAGSKLEKTNVLNTNDLTKQRKAHLHSLKLHYGTVLGDWMEN